MAFSRFPSLRAVCHAGPPDWEHTSHRAVCTWSHVHIESGPVALCDFVALYLLQWPHMKDLGMIFDTELNFVQHSKEKINTAYSYLGIIKRNFIYLDEEWICTWKCSKIV